MIFGIRYVCRFTFLYQSTVEAQMHFNSFKNKLTQNVEA